MADFWDKLGDSFVKVSEAAGMNLANQIGGSAPATATTVEDDGESGISSKTATALIITGAAVLGVLVLVVALK